MKNEQNNKMNTKGFTLLELLVVVLIIGILAAIALPQYQLAVGKAKFATIKTITRNVQDAVQRYYLVNGTYSSSILKKLDIDLPNTVSCIIFSPESDMISCEKRIFGSIIRYYVYTSTGKPRYCTIISNTDRTSKSHLLCKKETNDNNPSCDEGVYCSYYY